MTVTIVSPDKNPETSSVDGIIINNPSSSDWADIHDAATGTAANTTGSFLFPRWLCDSVTGKWTYAARGFLLFDTSAIPSGDTILSATLEIVVSTNNGVIDDFGGTSLALATSSPALDTELGVADFDQVGAVHQSSLLALANIIADQSTYNAMVLNAAGRASINKGGITKFALVADFDLDDLEPTWAADSHWRVLVITADSVVGLPPRLTIEHEVVVVEPVGLILPTRTVSLTLPERIVALDLETRSVDFSLHERDVDLILPTRSIDFTVEPK